MEIEHICGDKDKIEDIANILVGGKCNYYRDVAIITMKEDIDMYANFFHRWHRVFNKDHRMWIGTFVMDDKTHIVFGGGVCGKHREEWIEEMNDVFDDFKTRGLIYGGDIKFLAENITFWLHGGEDK